MINIAKLLKDCPQGMELDCTMYDNVSLIQVLDGNAYPIKIDTPDGQVSLTKHGCYSMNKHAKCIIFPKGKTTWEGFVPPCKFKDGDIVYVKSNEKNEYIIIFKEIKNNHIHKYACFAYQHLSIDKCALCHLVDAEIMRIATEEEKQKLFDAIKENGYTWNAETKTLEKVIVPKFKAGDYVAKKGGIKVPVLITSVSDECYYSNTGNSVGYFMVKEQDDWELVPNKFDITTLKPFDKVLVRTVKFTPVWTIAFFDGYQPNIGGSFRPFGVANGEYFQQCIPYEGNEHLRATTNDCDEYYKNW